MTYSNIYLSIFGALGLVFWLVRFFHLFKQVELFLPNNIINNGKSIVLSRTITFILGVSAWVLISFSLAGPKKSIGFAKNSITVNDVYLVVDVSRSMLANDFSPNRLEASKNKIIEFVNLRPTDRIGIIIFSEMAYTLLPLTTDMGLVKKLIKEIKIGFLGSGTNIGDAVGLAIARLASSPTKNKIVVLLTDGVSNVGAMTPMHAARVAQENNVKLYTIGIGGNKNALIPLGTPRAGVTQRYQRIPGGSIDLNTLKQMATLTGGKDYFAGDVGALARVFMEIESLEKIKIKGSRKQLYKEHYLKYLIWGVLLLIFVEILNRFMNREFI